MAFVAGGSAPKIESTHAALSIFRCPANTIPLYPQRETASLCFPLRSKIHVHGLPGMPATVHKRQNPYTAIATYT